jgi:hypothetical protein
MKKSIVACLLLLTGMTEFVCAQDQGLLLYTSRSKAEKLFGIMDVEWPRHHFDIALKNGNTVTVRVADKASLERILDLDSLFKAVWKDLVFLKDSLQDEMSSKRIDYLTDQPGRSRVRFHSSQQRGQTFVVDKGEPKLLRIDQDTLIIIEQQIVPGPERPERSSVYIKRPYKITLLINNITQLETLLDGSLNIAMQQFKQQWDELKPQSKSTTRLSILHSYYNTTNTSLNRPITSSFNDKHKLTLEPYIQFGIQNINSRFVSSAGAGIDIIYSRRAGLEHHHQFTWEPYFLFDQQTDGKFRMRRNDFISYQHLVVNITRTPGQTQSVRYAEHFSIGYLVHRSGNFFRNNTFKAGLPGASFNALTLHPEFIFNGLFKNFQPGIKLYVFFD